jgi:nitrogen fixation/metabolism regulation signal transduction histidine kinase
MYFANSVNRKLSFFFDSVSNEDSTLHYSENLRNKSVRELHQSLNKLNNRISEIKIRNEYNERFYREMLKYSATGLMAVDNEGYIDQINDSALALLGMQHISHISLLKQKNEELYNHLIQIRPGQTLTIKLLCGTDLRLLSLKVSLLRFGEKRYKLYSLHDIKTELEENELDSWQKLIRVMTHEIMNSIGPITSLSNILNNIYLKEGKPISISEITDKQIQNTIHGLDVIEQTSRGLMHFVEDYRQLTRIPKPVFKPVNISSWLNSIELLMQNKFQEEKIDFRILHKESHKELIGDEKLLTQVMINLLNNSVEALKNSTRKKITISVNEGISGKLKVSVTDNGSGIAPEEIEKIFVPFYTTRDNGSGIGLSLSRQIMRLHKGSIAAFSKQGEQTTMVLSF